MIKAANLAVVSSTFAIRRATVPTFPETSQPAAQLIYNVTLNVATMELASCQGRSFAQMWRQEVLAYSMPHAKAVAVLPQAAPVWTIVSAALAKASEPSVPLTSTAIVGAA